MKVRRKLKFDKEMLLLERFSPRQMGKPFNRIQKWEINNCKIATLEMATPSIALQPPVIRNTTPSKGGYILSGGCNPTPFLFWLIAIATGVKIGKLR